MALQKASFQQDSQNLLDQFSSDPSSYIWLLALLAWIRNEFLWKYLQLLLIKTNTVIPAINIRQTTAAYEI